MDPITWAVGGSALAVILFNSSQYFKKKLLKKFEEFPEEKDQEQLEEIKKKETLNKEQKLQELQKTADRINLSPKVAALLNKVGIQDNKSFIRYLKFAVDEEKLSIRVQTESTPSSHYTYETGVSPDHIYEKMERDIRRFEKLERSLNNIGYLLTKKSE